jgi:hypothetical protein
MYFIINVIINNFSYKLDDDWYSRWLCTPREDGKPRVLILEPFAERSIFAFIEHIKKVNYCIWVGIYQ